MAENVLDWTTERFVALPGIPIAGKEEVVFDEPEVETQPYWLLFGAAETTPLALEVPQLPLQVQSDGIPESNRAAEAALVLPRIIVPNNRFGMNLEDRMRIMVVGLCMRRCGRCKS